MARHRLNPDCYRDPGSVWHIVIGTDQQQRALTDPETAQSVISSITFKCRQTQSDALLWCVMPDHFHALVTIGEGDLVRMVNEIKSYTGRGFTYRTGKQLWRPSFYDRGVRLTEPIDKVALYIINNPVRAGLVHEWHEWPWTGGMLIDIGQVSDRSI